MVNTVPFAGGLAAAGKLLCYFASQVYCEHNINNASRDQGQGIGPNKRARCDVESLLLMPEDNAISIGRKLFRAKCSVDGGKAMLIEDGVRIRFDTHTQPILRKVKKMLQATAKQWQIGLEALATAGLLKSKGQSTYVLTRSDDVMQRAHGVGIPRGETAWFEA